MATVIQRTQKKPGFSSSIILFIVGGLAIVVTIMLFVCAKSKVPEEETTLEPEIPDRDSSSDLSSFKISGVEYEL